MGIWYVGHMQEGQKLLRLGTNSQVSRIREKYVRITITKTWKHTERSSGFKVIAF